MDSSNEMMSLTGAKQSEEDRIRRKLGVVFLGDESVGKTSIVTRYAYDHFEEKYTNTIGIDFVSKSLITPDYVTRLQIWDTAGQERFRSLTPSYIRMASIVIIVYDITKKKSFENAKEWIKGVHNERGNDIGIVLVGNKLDLASNRQVSIVDGERFALKYKIPFFETSAKTNENINQIFDTTLNIMKNKLYFDTKNNDDTKSDKKIELEKIMKSGQEPSSTSSMVSPWCCFAWLW